MVPAFILLKNRYQIFRVVSCVLKVNVDTSMPLQHCHHNTQSTAVFYNQLCQQKGNKLLETTSHLNAANRWKSKNKGKNIEKDDEYESIELTEEDDSTLGKDSKIVNVSVTSLRTDLLVKAALNTARNKVETLFYESKILVNGKKLLKKSNQVFIGDEIDIVRGPSPNNPDHFIEVTRLKVLAATQKNEERIVVRLRRFAKLTVEDEK